MNSKLFVGSLPWATDDQALLALFTQYGQVKSAQVLIDRETNRSRGFGFVEMSTPDEAEAAMKALHDSDYQGRKLVVNFAKPREDRPR